MPEKKEQIIDPWGAADLDAYSDAFKKFGLHEFPQESNKNLNHYLFERKIVIAHRDFGKIMKKIEEKKPFINMTGIASSGRIHLGHKVDVEMFKFFKEKGAKNYFAICDIDAYVSRPDNKVGSMKEAKEFAVDNLSHVLALGLDENDVYIQSQMDSRYYEFTFEISKKITENMFQAIYGHLDLGKASAVLLQIADILHGQLEEYGAPMPSITGIGLEQDPHARLTRDVAKRLPYKMEPPSFIYFKHQGGLQPGEKMSSSKPETAIFLDDSATEIKKKINSAFTGGQPTAEEHRKKGGNLKVDKVYEMLLFHYPDTKKLEKIAEEFSSGKMLSGELKQFAIEFFTKELAKHQEKAEKNKELAKQIVYGKK
ncbi:MAG: tryptophan--tRNA ligase [archaeon]|jgi:tryptophanyl-tRNA synthetase